LVAIKQPKEMNEISIHMQFKLVKSANGLGMRLGVGWPILVSWYIALELCTTFFINDFEKVLDYTLRIG